MKKTGLGKVRKTRGNRDSWKINYCYAGKRSAVHFSLITDGPYAGEYFCYAGASTWYAPTFAEAVSTCRDIIRQIGGFVD
ncbi:MAG: hypothetical protein K2M42_05950 [Oscillospiraceae bacterium]|nr:hypothetical protein [Oscillospiraceae bacterium]